MKRAALLAVIAACGAKQHAGSWVEREAPLGVSHAGGAGPTKSDSATRAVDVTNVGQLDEASVLIALERVGDAAPAGALALRAARFAYHRGDEADARRWLARASTAADAASVHDEVQALAALLAAPPVDRAVVAVLLPLSGRFASIGNELRAAIQLAPAPGTTWLFLDTKGEPDGAVAAVDAAVAKGAVAILGPVGQREALVAARAATLHQMPIALLAPADGADPAAGVFRLVDSPADEGRAVAALAQDDSFPTVAVFAPRDDVGQEAAEAFAAEATRRGLAVTAQGTYDPTGGDVEADVKRFLNLVPAQNPRFAQHLAKYGKKGWTTFTPDVPYSLLYIPDRHDTAAIVAAFLPYYGVELRTEEFPDPAMLTRKHGGVMPQVVQLVGGAGWNHPSLPIRGGTAVQGALVVDAFVGDAGGDAAAQFAAAFQQRTTRAPTSAAAQAHDAAMLVGAARVIAARAAADPRDAFRAALARSKLDDGACGAAAMDVDGELHRTPFVLEVQSDQLELVP